STVTYTEVSSPFEGLSDIGSPGVVGPEHEGLPWMLDDPYVQEDEVFLAKEQPLPAAASPTAQSPDYVPVSDPEEDPEEDNDEDPEEDPVDYPTDRGDDGNDENESSGDDKDDDVDIEAGDEEEEKEHPAPVDSIAVALPAADQAPSAEETGPFETNESAATPPPHPTYRIIARIFILAPVPTPVWSDVEVARLLAISTPPSSPLSLWSSPLPQIPSPPLPQIPLPPLLVSSLVLVLSPSPPASPIRLLGYRAAMIRLRAEAASTSHSLPLPPPIILSHTRPDAPSSRTPPLHLLSTDHGYGDQADLERDVRYGITLYSWMRIVEGHADRRAYARTARLIETKARMSREAWGRSMDASDLAHAEVMSLRTTVLAQQCTSYLSSLKQVKRLHDLDGKLQRQQGPAKVLHSQSSQKEQLAIL
ncbi:hypothetical protein Tco_0911400, partial [Tanacetum coccineum]